MPPPSFAAFAWYWLKLGCLSFGGPAGQIAMMQAELVDRRGWIDQTRFLHALNFCMLLPGPEAQQLATYVGWRMRGIAGGLVSGGLFVLPGACVLLALSWLAAAHGDAPAVAAVLSGVKPAVVAIVAAAVWRVGRRTLKGPAALALALAAFAALALLGLPFPLVVAAAATAGLASQAAGADWFPPPPPADGTLPPPGGSRPGRWRTLRLAGVFAVLWAVPVALVLAVLGPDPWTGIAVLFTKAAFVTFGGAYAVLPYVAQQGVESYGWLTPADMVTGLALAETTPGPLILVTQYVGFFAGWNAAGDGGAGFRYGAYGAALTTYVTFLPCFLFIFAGAPHVERLIHDRRAAAALAAVTAAVVGVIANLGVYLGAAVLLPEGRPDPFAWIVAAAALLALLRWNVAVHWVVLGGAVAGLATAAT